MNSKSSRWEKLFLFCLGLFLASSFAMKWMEPDLVYRGEPISIFGLELFYPAERIEEIFRGIDGRVRTILEYHLSIDFLFMAGCFPGIASLCMIAAHRLESRAWKRFLFILAFLQLFAWLFDVIENYNLLSWLNNPQIESDEFRFYHVVVYSKWTIALLGTLVALIAIGVNWIRKKRVSSKSV